MDRSRYVDALYIQVFGIFTPTCAFSTHARDTAGSCGHQASIDAAARVTQMEFTEAAEGVDMAEKLEGLGLGDLEEARGSVGGDGNDGGAGDTLCSVVLGLLTTVVELGEEKRSPKEEEELQGMLEPLKV